jgi:hypothetical protein
LLPAVPGGEKLLSASAHLSVTHPACLPACLAIRAGKFAPGDWTCTGCGNVNWERRKTCNQCNTPKPGTFDTNREGAGGGFKERDDVEAEEARKRRREREEKEE